MVGFFSLMLLGELAGVLRLKLCETATFVAYEDILRFNYKYRTYNNNNIFSHSLGRLDSISWLGGRIAISIRYNPFQKIMPSFSPSTEPPLHFLY